MLINLYCIRQCYNAATSSCSTTPSNPSTFSTTFTSSFVVLLARFTSSSLSTSPSSLPTPLSTSSPSIHLSGPSGKTSNPRTFFAVSSRFGRSIPYVKLSCPPYAVGMLTGSIYSERVARRSLSETIVILATCSQDQLSNDTRLKKARRTVASSNHLQIQFHTVENQNGVPTMMILPRVSA